MLPYQGVPHRHRVGILRREALQVGMLGALGATMTSAFRPAAAAPVTGLPKSRAKGVILIWLSGGPPQMQFWDPKPESPVECRGTGQAISTSAPGVQMGHRLPLLARQAHRFALVRSITLNAEDDNHILGNHKLLSAYDATPANFKIFPTREEWPSMGSVITYKQPNTTGLPTAVSVPKKVTFTSHGVPGETGGWLGSRYDPWHLEGDPSAADYRVPDLVPLPGFTVDRIQQRQALLQQIDGYRQDLERDLNVTQLNDAQSRAFGIATSAATRDAFDLSREPAKLRELYGRHTWGQSLLLARRLRQAGVKFVQANLGTPLGFWDYHQQEDKNMDSHCPPLDRALSGFFEDMAQTGLLEETMVLVLSEMGRNPILGRSVAGAAANAATRDGRNHWQWCWTGLFAGAGVRGGTVVGESDEWAGYVKSDPFFPSDIGATVYHAMGIDPHSMVQDIQTRPMYFNEGQVITQLF